jgi:hypothetical protein
VLDAKDTENTLLVCTRRVVSEFYLLDAGATTGKNQVMVHNPNLSRNASLKLPRNNLSV